MVDYNQALSVAEALKRGRMLDEENILWLEEPIRHDNFSGSAQLTSELKTPIQIGENFSEAAAMATALAVKACDYVMPDLERIGGVSGWQRAAALARSWGMKAKPLALTLPTALLFVHPLVGLCVLTWIKDADCDPVMGL